MSALPGNYAIHAHAIADRADREARLAADRAANQPQPLTVHLIDARDIAPGDVICLDSGDPISTVRDVTDVNGRTNMARVWTTTGQVITYAGQLTVARPKA